MDWINVTSFTQVVSVILRDWVEQMSIICLYFSFDLNFIVSLWTNFAFGSSFLLPSRAFWARTWISFSRCYVGKAICINRGGGLVSPSLPQHLALKCSAVGHITTCACAQTVLPSDFKAQHISITFPALASYLIPTSRAPGIDSWLDQVNQLSRLSTCNAGTSLLMFHRHYWCDGPVHVEYPSSLP
jgi:hypothetical protein